jgi:Fe-S-cluster containining protein
MSVMKKDGFNFVFNPDACKECAARCCTGESGYIYVTKEEMNAISESLGIQIREFADTYLFKKDYKYSIKERKNGESYECIFYDSAINGCSIYETRPMQCSTFPFWDYYKTRVDELKEECPGVQNV